MHLLKNIFFCTVFLFVFISLDAEQETKEVRVYLQTESVLDSLYIGNFQNKDNSFSDEYIEQLQEILCFDFRYNGSTELMAYSGQKESLLQQTNIGSAFNPKVWKSLGTVHVIRGFIKDRKLFLEVFSSQTGSLKQFDDLELTGSLGKDRKQVHRLADAVHKALFGEDGVASTRILYAAKLKQNPGRTGDWISEIWSCDWDGANPKQMTKEKSYNVTPLIIPSVSDAPSDKFLYVSYKLGQPKIFIASAKEGIGKRLIELKGHQILPAISRQKDKIAFISDAAGKTDLFLQEFHPETGEVGKPVQLFSFPRSTQASPTFSPDGKKIAFVSDKDGTPKIYIIPATFQGKRAMPILISKQNQENTCPSWSPDGKKIAYSAKTKGIRQIWIYDVETREEKQLTDGTGHKENPFWAPNSKHLVFNSTSEVHSDLYVVNIHQPEAIKISQGPGIKHYPSWATR